MFLKSFLLLKDWYRCFHYENVFNEDDITFFSRTVFISKKEISKKPAVSTGLSQILYGSVSVRSLKVFDIELHVCWDISNGSIEVFSIRISHL